MSAAMLWVRCPACRLRLPVAPERTRFALCACGYRIDHIPGKPLELSTFDSESEARSEFLRSLWRELHSYTFVSPEAAQDWLARWVAKIPSFGCSCAQHFREIYDKRKPDFSSSIAFYRWGVAVHNDVNELLGKPLWVIMEPSTCAICNNPATRICSYTLSIGMCGYPLCDDCTHAHTL